MPCQESAMFPFQDQKRHHAMPQNSDVPAPGNNMLSGCQDTNNLAFTRELLYNIYAIICEY